MAREIATHFKLDHYFEEIYGAELDGRFVDKAELIAHFSAIHELPESHGIMIGGTAFDMRAGRLNGLKTIGVTWGYGTDDQMLEAAILRGQATFLDFFHSRIRFGRLFSGSNAKRRIC